MKQLYRNDLKDQITINEWIEREEQNEQKHRITLQPNTTNRRKKIEIRGITQPQNNI